MFKLFHKPSLPAFPALAAYAHKDQYFCRIATWHWFDKHHIVVKDPNAPRLITMDPWPQLVFLDAMGKLTVAGYVAYMAHRYSGKTPDKLDATIIHELEQLRLSKLLAFADKPIAIQPAHDKPYRGSGSANA
ncbi:hypothetical protein FNT36_07830 [Hymenobacter setariae]|uniref:Uncharacterized protein n=1 Tax=Hymenobacter setariae TaxID=2594794 RepID=A0A558BXV9_9BACT|nr:hypothetical protein [Hymenobacter setariae]TVT41354.1 hypothetical protein FNT36_07830 [Hymenobacter setariae]